MIRFLRCLLSIKNRINKTEHTYYVTKINEIRHLRIKKFKEVSTVAVAADRDFARYHKDLWISRSSNVSTRS